MIVLICSAYISCSVHPLQLIKSVLHSSLDDNGVKISSSTADDTTFLDVIDSIDEAEESDVVRLITLKVAR